MNLIITGSAECLFEDFRKAIEFFDNFDLMAVNMSGICFNNVKHLASLHHERMEAFFKAAMLDNGRHIITHSIKKSPYVEVVWDIFNNGGSSALFAVKVGLRLGYDKIILCGVPLTAGRRFYDYDRVSEIGDKPTFEAWKAEKLPDKVKSMSGRTKDLLGYPTKEWANGL